MAEIHGTAMPGFEEVREGFALGQRDDGGAAQLAVYQDGELVVDLWTSGDPVPGRAVGGDALTVVMSVTKGVLATCVHMLARRGLLDLDAPVAAYWPEFAARDKAGITVSDLLAHRSGLSGLVRGGEPDWFDWDACVHALAEAAPLWEPGTAAWYHTFTYGHLLGEVVRRVTGLTPGEAVAELVSRPLGLDLWIGLPEEQEHRFVPQYSDRPPTTEAEAVALLSGWGFDPEDPLVGATIGAHLSVDASISGFNTRRAHAAQVPAANGVSDARSLARMYAAVIGEVDGVRLLDDAAVARAAAPRTDGLPAPAPFDRLPSQDPTRFGLGYELPRRGLPMLGPGSFGHAGAGGRLAYAQPATGTAIAYTCARMTWPKTGPDPRWAPWTEALRRAVPPGGR